MTRDRITPLANWIGGPLSGCQVVPTSVDLRLGGERRSVVEFYGYDLDIAGVNVMLVDADPARITAYAIGLRVR